ncbi:MAG TPA: helix-turn-helix domain-containing protein [Balneolaceae bacterium]|nr:helix-turn-helix domain-containing protein [Balneolaceae bacterium]
MANQPFDEALFEYKESLHPGDKLGIDKEVGPYYHYILDWQTRKYDYLSNGIKELTGYDDDFLDLGIEAYFRAIHPDDIEAMQKITSQWMELLLGKQEEEFNRHSGNFNYRLRKKNGTYVNILQQPVYISFDNIGNIVYEAGILVDITRFKNDGNISLLINKPDGTPLVKYYPKEEYFPLIGATRSKLADLDRLSTHSDISLLRRIPKIILEHLDDGSFNVEKLSHKLNISRSYLYRQLKSELNITPIQLIRLFRLQKSLELISAKDLTIAEVAYRVGFNSAAYFARCFYEQFNCTPTDYRKQVS